MRRVIAALLVVVSAIGVRARAQGPSVDVLIRRGDVVDGTGSAPRVTDVGVRGERIVFIGDARRARLRASRTIDAKGLVVAPGFIDPHTHTQNDLSSPERHANVAYLMQGVTTVVTNNDGGGPVDIGRVLDLWTTQGIGTNALLYVPQGSVRAAVMGMSASAATAAQLDSMRALVRRGMDAGAFGISTGLYYAPGSYSSTEEVIELARVAAARGGVYDTHMRDESSYTIGLIAAVNEVIRIGREAQIPVHISHIKALGADVWGLSDSVIALVNAARASGVEVTASQYPYLASGTSIGASLLPRWAEAGGRDSLRARIADSATKARLVADMQNNLRRRGGAASLLITSTSDPLILGKTLEQVAAERHETPIAAAIDIVQQGDASVASFNMNESDLEKFMVQDWVMTDSDGSDGHPRKYGTFPRKFHEYVFTKHLLTLPQAVRQSSAATAAALRIPERGVLEPGYLADIVVFDSATFVDHATFAQPTLPATGVKYLLVNGTVTIDNGRYTGALAGKALRKSTGRPR